MDRHLIGVAALYFNTLGYCVYMCELNSLSAGTEFGRQNLKFIDWSITALKEFLNI